MTNSMIASHPTGRLRRWIPAAVFAAVTLLIYIDVLFDPARLAAAANTDLTLQFISWRDFGFREILTGNFPLWNPHIFGGTPYMASFQSALFYPVNYLHLFLPLGLAISWYCAIHTFLMGLFMSFWARYRGVGIAGQALAGVMAMFSGQYFLHVYAGHLPHLAAMVYVPLILLSVDALADGRSWRWMLLGAGAVALQILAGHPQYVFYTGMIVVCYGLMRAIASASRLRLLMGTSGFYLLGASLACIQLVPGIEAAGENIRSGGLPYAMASQFSMSPWQWLTLLSQSAFGHGRAAELGAATIPNLYYAPGYLWEMSAFVSVSGLALAVIGLVTTSRRNRVISVAMLGVIVILASGRFTPLHRLLCDHLPMFGSFRVPAKFVFFLTLLLSLLAAEGLEALRNPTPRLLRRSVLGCLVAAAAVLILAIVFSTTGIHGRMVDSFGRGPDQFVFSPDGLRDPSLRRMFLHATLIALGFAIATLLVVAGLLAWRVRSPWARLALLALAIIELGVAAIMGRGQSESSLSYPAEWVEAMAGASEPYRCLHLQMPMHNMAMSLGAYEMWGYDPGVLRRYGLLIAASQGIAPEQASQYVVFNNPAPFDRLYRMFRLKWAMTTQPRPVIASFDHPLPQVLLVNDCRIEPDRSQLFRRLLAADFDPAQTVYLEESPDIPVAAGPLNGGTRVLGQDTDTLEIEAETDRPAILLVTDNFARGWRVRPVGQSPQPRYQVLPANYALRAIPLAAGRHHFLLSYEPMGWIIGRWVSAGGLAIFGGLALLAVRQTRVSAGAMKA